MKYKRKRYGLQSVFVKQIIGFAAGNLCIAAIITALFINVVQIAQTEVYDKMKAQSEYYLHTLDIQLENIYNLQVNFFHDRRLVFLMEEKSTLSGYERRDALLSLKERLQAIQGCSDMISEIYLFIPNTGYLITTSSVGKMEEEDHLFLDEILTDERSGLHIGENKMYFLERDTYTMGSNSYPAHMVCIELSRKKIEENMMAMIQEEGSGAFFWKEGKVILDAGREVQPLGNEILPSLVKDENGAYLETQRVSIGEEYYLACVGQSELLGTFVQYSNETLILDRIDHLRYAMYGAWLVMLVITVFFIIYTQYLIHRPMELLLQAFDRAKTGNFEEHIHHGRNNEFAYLYNGFNEMEDRIKNLIEQVYIQTNLAQKAELKQLQSQINPHFLYNSLFALESRIHREDYEGAENLADLLGKYFRYLTRNGEDDVELSQEVEHAYAYGAIQASRFSSRISIEADDLPEEMEHIRVPRLILQPLLENALDHGLGEMEEGGLLQVRYEVLEDGFSIAVEDNGEETTDEMIEDMKKNLEKGEDQNGEITGILNIHRRLQLYFKGQAGLRIERGKSGGICVRILIRGIKKNV
jgi:two-component system sensor histidine kinase YesM